MQVIDNIIKYFLHIKMKYLQNKVLQTKQKAKTIEQIKIEINKMINK